MHYLCFNSSLRHTQTQLCGPLSSFGLSDALGEGGHWPRKLWRVEGGSPGAVCTDTSSIQDTQGKITPLVLHWLFCVLMQYMSFFSDEQSIKHMEVNLIFSLNWNSRKLNQVFCYLTLSYCFHWFYQCSYGYSIFWIKQIVTYINDSKIFLL